MAVGGDLFLLDMGLSAGRGLRNGWRQLGPGTVAFGLYMPLISGLLAAGVAALNGMPGVLSARWSGTHGDDAANYSLLLAQMGDVPDFRRGAAFVSACALVSGPDEVTVVRGVWPGAIAREPLGQGGFGYDPVFIPEGGIRSAAQLSPAEKDAVSHRGRALALLVPALRGLASGAPPTG
jgi:XTP/dITP diphosphohydrolase